MSISECVHRLARYRSLPSMCLVRFRSHRLPPASNFKDYCAEASVGKTLEPLRTICMYPPTYMVSRHNIAMLVFSDAGGSAEKSQQSYIVGLLLYNHVDQITFHKRISERGTALSVLLGWLRPSQPVKHSTMERCSLARYQALQPTRAPHPRSLLT